MANQRSQRRTTQPVCEALESRALLNAAMAEALDQHHAAEIQIARKPAPFPSPVLNHLNQLPTVSTVPPAPAPADTNPYGVAFVPSGFPSTGGKLNPGDILVSNFNNSVADGSVQGTGTTIVRITPQGQVSTFFQGTPPLGLDTALAVLKSGFVLVGNAPTTTGVTPPTVQKGSILVLDNTGKLVETLPDPNNLLNGPWDLAVNDQGNHAQVFVSNVLSGTVTRLDLTISPSNSTKPINVTREVQIASGYTHRTDPAALVLGPTGLAFDAKKNVLYVASTADNEIFAIRNAATRRTDAGKGTLVYQDNAHLRGPLGLVLAPNGDLITANGDAVNPDTSTINPQNSELVEFTPKGKFVAQFQLDPALGGAFGLAISPFPTFRELAAVNDITNSLEEFAIF